MFKIRMEKWLHPTLKFAFAADRRSILELIKNTRGDKDIIYDCFYSARTCKRRIFLVVGSVLLV